MSVTLQSPPEPHRPVARPKRKAKRLGEFDSLLPALGITALLHVLLFEFVRHSTLFAAAPARLESEMKPQPLEVVHEADNKPIPANLLPPQMRPPVPKFVEVNPMAPSRLPDRTNNTGAADQRSAQPVPNKDEHADRAKVTGEEKDSDRIVNAVPREFLPEKDRPVAGSPLGAPTANQPAPQKQSPAPAPAKAAEGPSDRADMAKGKPVVEKGAAFAEKTGTETLAHAGTGDKKVEMPSPKKIEGLKDGSATGKGKDASPKTADAKAAPASAADKTVATNRGENGDISKPRPRASFAGTSGPLAITKENSNEAGDIAVDSRFSRMGEYTSRMMETIQAGWWASLDRSRIMETGRVVIEFTLNKDGTVTRARITEQTTSMRAALLCLGAVTDRAPFDEWPEDMIGIFGDKQEGTITFHYR